MIVTVDGLDILHEYNQNTYLPKNSPEVFGGMTLNGNENEGLRGVHTNGDIVSILDLSETNNLRVGYGNYTSNSGNTNIYGKDVNIWCGEIKNLYRPYYRTGDIIDFTGNNAANVVGWVDGAYNVVFTIPLTKPVIGNPTATATSVKGFIFRQNETGVFGVEPEYRVMPKTCTVAQAYNAGFVVRATFENNSGVKKYSPIGINWDGKITLS
jgi:hypothetical protein